MKLELLNFYFEQSGFKKKSSKLFYQYERGKYLAKISPTNKKCFLLFEGKLILETGIPTNEPSIVKWVNILIDKNEKENIQIGSAN